MEMMSIKNKYHFMLFTRVKPNHSYTNKKIVHVKFNRLAEKIHV
jgi:hypothetical protein